MTPALPSSPAALRNREPILGVLRDWLPEHGRVLEMAAGTGEHAVFLAAALPGLLWRPTDADAGALAVIAARRAAEGPANLLPPLRADATDPDGWPTEAVDGSPDAVVAINMIHIAPWAACEGLIAGAARNLKPGGVLFLYGPFQETGVPTAVSNQSFGASLRARDPRWGLRDLDAVTTRAGRRGLEQVAQVAMPANNLSVVFRRA